MVRAITYAMFLSVMLLLVSCEKKEELWDLPPGGGETIETFDLGPNYENIIFYQLETKKTYMANLFSWDIAFATGTNEHHIVMNGGKEVQVYNTNDTDFAKTYATTKVEWQWDNPNGDKDSTAVGDWCDTLNLLSANKVYVFDLKGASPRYKKVKFISCNATQYVVKVANMDNTGEYEATVTKDDTRNFVYFNLQSNQVVNYEPASADWDIVFTRYRHVYYDLTPVTPYLVNGILINTKHVSIEETNSLTFEDITAEVASTLLYTKKEDEIGFDWKTYNIDAGRYTVNPKQIFLIKMNNGDVYKLRFVDFYNEQGVKGFPKFMYQKL
jgi:hypothetical protein